MTKSERSRSHSESGASSSSREWRKYVTSKIPSKGDGATASKSGKILDCALSSSKKGKPSALGKRLFDRTTLRRSSRHAIRSAGVEDAKKTLSRKSFRKHFRSQVTLAFADEFEDIRQLDTFDARAASLVASAVDAWEAVVPESERLLAAPVQSK